MNLKEQAKEAAKLNREETDVCFHYFLGMMIGAFNIMEDPLKEESIAMFLSDAIYRARRVSQ